MKYLLLIQILLLFQSSLAQTLTARVADHKGNPIEGAKVFFDLTTVSSATNKSGFFEIPKPVEVGSANLIIYHPLFETLIESETDDLLPTYTLSQRADKLTLNYN